MSTDTALLFGPFRLDPASGRLYRDGSPIPLPPKAFALLHYLADRPDRLVSKQELLEAVWPRVFVTEAVLKVTIRDVRRALGDRPQSPTYIQTAHRRGYRFVAAVRAEARAAGRLPVTPPPVRYARSGSVNIAYQVVGSGPIDLVFVMGWVSHLEYFWREPSFARFLTELASMARLILFDKRGTGLSDAVPINQLPTLDERMDDVRAVMDAAGSERAVLMGVSEGGPLCTLFAATHPEKTEAIIMFGSYARRLADADYPWGMTREAHEAFCRTLLERWGGPVGLEERAPSRLNDPAFRDWWATYLRMGASPGAAVALTRMNGQIDVRDLLPSVPVPTLVLHRTGDCCLKVEEGRYLASRIPGATFVELAGIDHLPFVGDQEAVLAEISRFLSLTRSRYSGDGALATELVVQVARREGPQEPASALLAQLPTYRGRLVRSDADRIVAVFDGPGRAVRCARAMMAAAGRTGLVARAGVHIGECEPGMPDGPLFEIADALAASAQPGAVMVSRTVVDLVHGSGLKFSGRGEVAVPVLARQVVALTAD